MNYIKKLCILKQISSGFAADGKKVSALLTAELFARSHTFTLALIGFAPLREGRYVCLICDCRGEREIFEIPSSTGTSVRRPEHIDLAAGFCCLVCHIGLRVVPVAFGKCGDYTYDVKKLCALLDARESPSGERSSQTNAAPFADATDKTASPAPTEPKKALPAQPASPAQTARELPPEKTSPPAHAFPIPDADPPDCAQAPLPYDDEIVATENYYEFDKEPSDEQHKDGKEKTSGKDPGNDADAQSLFRFASAENLREDAQPSYYNKVKGELSAIFGRYPAEEDLAETIPYSRWAKVHFSRDKYYTVGVICDETRAKYICYGVPADSRKAPPDALKNFCSYLPLSVFDLNGKGYWMMFQDAETGQCVKISSS